MRLVTHLPSRLSGQSAHTAYSFGGLGALRALTSRTGPSGQLCIAVPGAGSTGPLGHLYSLAASMLVLARGGGKGTLNIRA